MSQPYSDSDISTDQTLRVARRVANGVYRLLHDGREVGEEVWGIFALRNGWTRLMTEINLQYPAPHQQRANLDVDAAWVAQGMWVQLDYRTKRSMAACAVADGVLTVRVTQMHLREEDKKARKPNLRLLSDLNGRVAEDIPSDSKLVAQRSMAFDANCHLDFDSALFNFVALQRLNLTRNGQGTFFTVAPSLPTLEPKTFRQTYRYERDETVGPEANRTVTHRYTIIESDPEGVTTTFWTDEHGIAQRQEFLLDGALHACELTSYRWLD